MMQSCSRPSGFSVTTNTTDGHHALCKTGDPGYAREFWEGPLEATKVANKSSGKNRARGGARSVSSAVIALLLQFGSEMAFADNPLERSISITIPVNSSLEEALVQFGRAAKVSILMDSRAIGARIVTHEVRGTLSAREALDKLLRDSGLSYRIDGERVCVVQTTKSLTQIRFSFLNESPSPAMSTSSDFESNIGAAGSDENSGVASDTTSRTDRSEPISEVVVTAEKREELIQNVPIPVSIVNTESLTQVSETRLQDYYTEVPSLAISNGIQSNQALTLRGLGAAVLLDDVPLPGSAIPDIDPGMLSRIEVLRGPQSTLYGASGLGGLVKFVTVDPSTAGTSGRLEAGFDGVSNGYDHGYSVRGSVNLPVTETLAVDVGAFTRQDAGYINNPVLDISGINRDEAHGVMLTALWQPATDVSVKFHAIYQEIRGGNADVDAYDGLTGQPLGNLQQSSVAGVGPYDRELQAYGLVVKTKVLGFDLTSVTGYNANIAKDYTDTSTLFGTSAAQAFPNIPGAINGALGAPLYTVQHQTNVTQELRFSRTFFDKLDLLFGGYYTHTPNPLKLFVYAESPTSPVIDAFYGLYNISTPYTEYAGFVDLTYHFTDRFDVQVGGRESHTTETFFSSTSGPFVSPLPSPQISPTTQAESNPATFLLTPRFKVTPDLMVYGRFATAFAPGGTNSPGPDIPPQYGPEKTSDYEIGTKGSVLDQRLSFDASLYYIKFIGIDNEFLNSQTNESYEANAGTAKSQGVELALEGRPTDSLTLSSWVVFNDAHLTDIPEGVIATGSPVAVGDPLPDSARFSGNLSAQQEFPLVGDSRGFVGATVAYIGVREGAYASTRQVYPAYAKTDLRAGVRYDSWSTTFYATNVANRLGIISGDNQSTIPFSRYYIQPRTIGVTVSKQF